MSRATTPYLLPRSWRCWVLIGLVSCAAGLPLHHDDPVSGEVLRAGETMSDWNPGREPLALVEQARHVRGRRSDPQLRRPAPGPGDRALDPAPPAAELISDTQAPAGLRAARVRAKETLLERRQALAPLHVRYLGMGGGVPPCHEGGSRGVQRYLSITGLVVDRFRLTGLQEVAAAIRSLLPGRKSPTAEPEPGPNDGAPA